MKWLYKLEYKFGKYYIRNLMLFVVAGMAVVYVADAFLGLGLSRYLSLVWPQVMRGQVWRLVTFVFVPSTGQPIFLIIALYFYYMMGRMLEQYWGGFRLNLYYLVGMVGAILAAIITGAASNAFLNLSLLLAFATISPDTQFLLFFILPIKAKWIAIAYAALAALDIVQGFLMGPAVGFVSLAAFGFSLLNYALFFGRSLVDTVRNQMRMARNRRNWHNRNR